MILAGKIGALLGFAMVIGGNSSVSSQRVDPNNPPDYLSRIVLSFDEFRGKYHYYPRYWFDIQLNCRAVKDPVCRIEEKLSEHERRSMTPQGSKYVYKIVQSSPRKYKVVAIDGSGCVKYYIDERRKPLAPSRKC